MIRRPPRSARTNTLLPFTPLFRSDVARLLAVGDQRGVVGEALVGGQLGAAGQLAELGPVLPALEAGERHEAVVARLVDVDEGVAGRVVALRHAPRHARSEERRVGNEWVSTCRLRWGAYH